MVPFLVILKNPGILVDVECLRHGTTHDSYNGIKLTHTLCLTV